MKTGRGDGKKYSRKKKHIYLRISQGLMGDIGRKRMSFYYYLLSLVNVFAAQPRMFSFSVDAYPLTRTQCAPRNMHKVELKCSYDNNNNNTIRRWMDACR